MAQEGCNRRLPRDQDVDLAAGQGFQHDLGRLLGVAGDIEPMRLGDHAAQLYGLLGGSVGFFGLLFLLFVRFVPFVAISEMKRLRHELAANDGREIGLPHV